MRPLLILLVILALIPTALASTVIRDIPSGVEPGTTFEVTLKISKALPGELFTIEEALPLQVDLLDWRVEGAKEAKDAIETRQKDHGFGWSFSPSGADARITYTAKVSEQATGPLTFEAVYFDPDGFNRVESTVSVRRNEEPPAVAESSGPGPAQQPAAPASPKKEASILVGVLISLAIVAVGLAVFYALTQPKKRKTPFNDAFFKKKKR